MTLQRICFAVFLCAALSIAAQTKPVRLPRVGDCGNFGDPNHSFHKAFIAGMRKHGWEEGRNYQHVYVPEGRECKEYMAGQDIDVLVGDQNEQPDPRVPVVTVVADVAGTPLAKSATRNITGLSLEDFKSIQIKRMSLLKELMGARHIYFMYAVPPEVLAKRRPEVKAGIGPPEGLVEEYRDAAAKLGVTIAPVHFTKFEDFEPAFRGIASKARPALIFYTSGYWDKIMSNGVGVEDFIKKHRLPFIMPQPDWVQMNDTVLMAYGRSYLEERERLAYFVDRILRGAKPADLPFEALPLRLGINLDAAKAFGITVPASLIAQADILRPYAARTEWITPEPGKERAR